MTRPTATAYINTPSICARWDQEDRLRALARRRGWHFAEPVVETAWAVSPEALADLAGHQCVIVDTLDRLGRHPDALQEALTALGAAGVRLVTADGTFDAVPDEARITAHVNRALSRHWLDRAGLSVTLAV